MQDSGASLPGFPRISDLLDPDLPAEPVKPDRLYRAPGKNDSYGYGFIDFDRHGFSIVNICSPVKREVKEGDIDRIFRTKGMRAAKYRKVFDDLNAK